MMMSFGWVLALCLSAVSLAPAQSSTRGTITGLTVTAEGGVRLPGAIVEILDAKTKAVLASTVSDAEGAFRFEAVPIAPVALRVRLAGFADAVTTNITMAPGTVKTIDIPLSVARLSETVQVTERQADARSPTETLSGSLIDTAPVAGDSYQALLPLVPGVVRGPDGRLRTKGGQPTQSGLQVSGASATDPSTGNLAFDLPGGAAETVSVLANPYAPEYGHFSSGLTIVETKQGRDTWKASVNGFLPRIRQREGSLLGTRGLRAFTPRATIGGPLVPGKLYLAQSLHYRYARTDVETQPNPPTIDLRSFDSFTRLDLSINKRHSLTGAVAFYPRNLDRLNMTTFVPAEAAASFRQRGFNVGVAETALLSPNAVLETMVNLKRYNVDITGAGEEPMQLSPEGYSGSFFNRQERNTQSIQVSEALTLAGRGAAKGHLFKLGFDVRHVGYDGASRSLPVRITRADGTLAEAIDFSGPTTQDQSALDLSTFAQDQWKPTERLELVGGVRVDRDGTLDRTNIGPRGGFTAQIAKRGDVIFRAGAGIFYEDTPLNVGAFPSFERRTIRHYATDGATLLGPQVTLAPVSGDLKTPRSVTWNAELNRRLGDLFTARANYLQRHGSHAFILEPHEADGTLQLSSEGRSKYHELELTLRYAKGTNELIGSYVASRSEGDLNTFDTYFGNIRQAVIRQNEYSSTDVDVPHRFVLRGSLRLPWKATLSPIFEVRDGFPFSAVDEEQQFVGSRNESGRFPAMTSLDITIERPVRIFNWNTRIGLRSFNALNHFNPRDLQTNVDALHYRALSNSVKRFIGITVWIDK